MDCVEAESRIIVHPLDLEQPIYEINDEVLCNRRDPPRILYHYTGREGLSGILETQSLWAKDFRCLGDDQEIECGHALIRDILKRNRREILVCCGQGETFPVIALFNEIEASIESDRKRFPDHFVACFSESGDNLKLWQEHGDACRGYSLGFDARELDACTTAGVRLLPVEYQQASQAQLVDSLINRVIKRARSLSDVESWDWPDLLPLLAHTLLRDLIDCLCSFKRECLSFEKEWRCVISPRGIQGALWDQVTKAGPSGEIKYVELRSRKRRFPLRQIVIGPEAEGFDSPLLDQLGVQVKKSWMVGDKDAL